MKKFMFALAIASLSSAAYAQMGGNSSRPAGVVMGESTEIMEVPVSRYSVETNRFFDNWFLDFGAGAQVLFGDNSDHGDFGKRIAPAFNVSLGKWFTPGLGLRLQFSGFQSKSYTPVEGLYTHGQKDVDGLYKQKFNYMNLHGDILFNLTNMLGGYNEARAYDFIPYLGFGFTHTFDTPHRQALAANFGIINSFHLSRAWDLNLELNGMVAEDKFDGQVGGKGLDLMVGASLGFAYKFPQRGFKHTPDVNAIMALSASQLDAINAALAQQMEQNKQLRNQLAQRPTETVVNEKIVVKEVPSAPQSVFFAIGSYKVPANADVNLRAIAEMMKKNPNMKLTLTGYADSDTGSSTLNHTLSQNRANAVAEALANMGVDRNRMTTVGKGGVNTLTPPYLNRRVIIEAQ